MFPFTNLLVKLVLNQITIMQCNAINYVQIFHFQAHNQVYHFLFRLHLMPLKLLQKLLTQISFYLELSWLRKKLIVLDYTCD